MPKSKIEPLPAVPLHRLVRLSGKKLVEYRKQLLAEMDKATGAMQDYADRLGDPKYPTAEANLKESALRYQRAVIAHMRTIAQSSVDVCLPTTESETKCAGCKKRKPTPLRNDAMGGYVCLTCIDRELNRLQSRLRWLHDCSTGQTDPEGYEWGIYRVKWENGKAVSVMQTLSDLSDLDAEMARELKPLRWQCGHGVDAVWLKMAQEALRAFEEAKK